jgi:hypothetical protein
VAGAGQKRGAESETRSSKLEIRLEICPPPAAFEFCFLVKNDTLPPTAWIRTLARPYLKGYGPRAERRGDLRGYWFHVSGKKSGAGFFAGYLVRAARHAHLNGTLPECLVFAFVAPGTALHRRIVRAEASLLRKTFEYIRWLTHRPPRFQFFDDQLTVMVRHQSMSGWPPEKREHFSRNFFIETFAWLVRSGLVRKLAEEAGRPASKSVAGRAQAPKVGGPPRPNRRPIAKSATRR